MKWPMNEMASQVIGGAEPTTSLGDLFIIERLPCLHGNLDSYYERNTGGEDRTSEQTLYIYMQWPSTEIQKL